MTIPLVALLMSSMLLAASSSAEQDEGDDRWRYMIGLLEIPSALGIFMSENSGQTPPKRAIKIYSAPTAKSSVVATVGDPEKLIQAKLSSEELGALVYKKRRGWYLIGLDDDKRTKGWVSPIDAGRFIPVDVLFISRLTYLNQHWDKRVWSLPRRGSASRRLRLKGEGNPLSYDVNITGTRRVRGELWLKVEVLGPGRCRGMNELAVIARGWTPAYTRKGELIAWYYSGGC